MSQLVSARTPHVWLAPAILAGGLVSAVCLRIVISGPTGPAAPAGGLAFALALAAVAVAALSARRMVSSRTAVDPSQEASAGLSALVTVLGSAVLVGVAASVHLRTGAPALPLAGFLGWAGVVAPVAIVEEWLFRGVAWRLLSTRGSEWPVMIVTSGAFALMHVPFYGWAALPIDTAAGLLLGAVRQLTGRWQCAAGVHLLADLAGWWLR